MNRKHALYVVLTAFLSISTQSFSMYKLIFRGAQLFSAGYCIRKGVHRAHRMDEIITSGLNELEPVREKNVLKWLDEETKKMGIASVQPVYGPAWASCREYISIPRSDSRELNFVLPYTQNLKKYHQAIQDRSDAEKEIKAIEDSYFYSTIGKICGYDQDHYKKYLSFHDDMIEINKRPVDKYHELVPRWLAVLKHELGHRENGDMQNRIRAQIGIPLVVQAIGSGSTYCFNKICNIKVPQTVAKTLLRSSFAVGSIPVKLAVSSMGYNLLCRYQEARADDFFLKKAETKAELEAFRDYLGESQKKLETALLDGTATTIIIDNIGKEGGSVIREALVEVASGELQNIAKNGDVNGQKDKWLRIAATAFDIKHPYLGDRIAKQQKHIDKWDAKHKEA